MQCLEKDSSNKAAWSQQACALTPGMQGLIDVGKGKISRCYPGKKLWEQAHRKFSLAWRKLVRATSSMTGPREQLMSVASFFIMFKRSSFRRWNVSSLRLQCRLTTCSTKARPSHRRCRAAHVCFSASKGVFVSHAALSFYMYQQREPASVSQ
jgi:hypothetical protein